MILLTFHEFGHAWMASKCGDDTAKHEGRCSLNPLVHIDPLGTVLIPLMQIFFPVVGSILIGWAKPVPVNPYNLRNEKVDDILISMAGPWMNLLLAVLFIGLAKVGTILGQPNLIDFAMMTACISLVLCFFNLLPIPPLDGSHVMRVLTGMSRETYHQLARYGFIILIVVINLTPVPRLVGKVVLASASIIAGWFGMV
ncbi:MAG: site-2 protease family protein [Verrucomicrobiota bacterium]